MINWNRVKWRAYSSGLETEVLGGLVRLLVHHSNVVDRWYGVLVGRVEVRVGPFLSREKAVAAVQKRLDRILKIPASHH